MMTDNYEIVHAIPVSRIFLNKENPRFEPVETEGQAIELLCAAEDIYALAADIVKQESLNPMERLALIPIESDETEPTRKTYTAAEGNRRLCALKLLDDPERAPQNLRKKFQALSKDWTPITTVPAAVFDSFEDVEKWLSRMHSGPQGGIGRKGWSSDQKQRFFKTNKNKVALEFLDYGEEKGFISKEERKGKLTTVSRFVTKEAFQEHIGLDKADPAELRRTRPQPEFDKLAKTFFEHLKGGEKVNSRMNKPEISAYARELTSEAKVTADRIEPEAIKTEKIVISKKVRRKKPKPPEQAQFITHDPDIEQALKDLGNYKLQSLYHSILEFGLKHHTPILSVGVWSFFETLTACAGYTNNDFTAYYSKDKIQNTFGISKGKTKSIRAALERISSYGNTTKHDDVGALFDGQQLNNDVQVLRDVILKTIAEAKSIKP